MKIEIVVKGVREYEEKAEARTHGRSQRERESEREDIEKMKKFLN